MKRTVLAFPLLLLAGCRSGPTVYVPTPTATVPTVSLNVKSPSDLMPLDVGNIWTYSMSVQLSQGGKSLGTGQETVSYQVDSKVGDRALLILDQGGKVSDRQDWRTTADGIYQDTGGPGRTPYSPPQPLVRLPIKVGDTYRWSGRGSMPNGKTLRGEARSEVLAPQTVDAGSGRVSAIPIVTNTTYPGGKSMNTSWFQPGVGLVRYRQETTDASGRVNAITLTLTSAVRKGS